MAQQTKDVFPYTPTLDLNDTNKEGVINIQTVSQLLQHLTLMTTE